MASNLRGAKAPPNLILFTSGSIPNGFIHECRLDNKYAIGIPCGVTDPGTSVGSATHQHASGGSHVHNFCGPTDHKHGFNTGSQQQNQALWGYGDGTHGQLLGYPHYHSVPVCSAPCPSAASAPACVASDAGHTHDSQSIDPEHKTLRHIRIDGSNTNPRRNIGGDVLMMWGGTVASIPGTIDGNHYGKHIKQITCGCASSGTTGGSTCHTHGCNSNHTHCVTVGAHSHSFVSPIASTATPVTGPNAGPCWYAMPPSNRLQGETLPHSHPSTNMTFGGCCTSTFTSDCGSAVHNHGGTCHIPQSKTTALFTKATTNLRASAIPNRTIGLWLEALACVPTGFQTADGTNCTPNYFNRLIKIVPCGSTDPGTDAGSACHTHSAGGGHSHTNASATGHAHPKTGTIGCRSGQTSGYYYSQGYACHSMWPHSHAASGSTFQTSITNPLDTSSTHQHTASNNKPDSVETAFIVKV